MMNDANTMVGGANGVTPPGKLAHATPETAPLVAGRRSFFKYRDLGVTVASNGRMRAQVTENLWPPHALSVTSPAGS